MALFERKHPVTALGDEALTSIKRELDSVLSIAASYDQMMSKTGDMTISLEGRIRGDLLAFMLYLSGITKGVRPEEIAVVNQIFDIDLSHVDFELFRKDVGNRSFEHAVPPSILILKELGNRLQHEQSVTQDGLTASDVAKRSGVSNMAAAFSVDLINLYALIGSAFLSADGIMVQRESADFIRYLYMMSRAVWGPNATLPEGAAQRVLEAHKRLFGKVPKIK